MVTRINALNIEFKTPSPSTRGQPDIDSKPGFPLAKGKAFIPIISASHSFFNRSSCALVTLRTPLGTSRGISNCQLRFF